MSYHGISLTHLDSFKQGGAFANDGGTVEFVDSTFRDNEATSGGAIYASQDSNMEVAKSSFDSNGALDGGAVYNGGISIIYDSTFMENFAGDAVSKDLVAALYSSTHVDCQLTIDMFMWNSGWRYY